MLGQTEEQPTTVEIVEPSTKMESSTQTAEEQKDDVQTLPIEGESHHVEMEHLPGPLSAYVSLNITPVKEVVGGEIAPTIPYSHVVTSEQIPQGSEPSTQHHDTDDAHPTIATPASGDIGTEIGLLTQEEIKELTSPDTISQETHVEILHPSTPTRVILHGKPPRNFLQRIEADVKEFVDGETSALTEFIKQEETAFVEAEKAILRSSFIQNNFGRMLGSKKPEQEEPAILSTSKDGPHFIREKGRTPKARLIGARSHVNNEVISPTQLSLEVPQKNVSVLRPNRSKQPPKQERLPSSSEDSSYTSFTAHVENKPTPSSQEQQAPIVESAPDIQTPSPIVEEVITQPPTVQEEQSSEVAQDPTTPEANPLIHLVQENESVRDIVYNHLAHIGAFEGLSEQKQNEILVRAILFVDEKRLVPNVNEVEAGQSIDLSTLTKEILSENDPTTSTPKSVGPFGRFSN
jgi:hypothetical protein